MKARAAAATISPRLSLAAGDAAGTVLDRARAALAQDGFDVDYFTLVDGPSLEPLDRLQPNARLITAARLGTVRLLDNMAA